jgi:cysteinyl-tRNA synthetase
VIPDTAHIGHASCYVKLDIVQRILRSHFKLNLVTAMNITDIDDKIIKRSLEAKEPWLHLAKRFEDAFWLDMAKLNIQLPDIRVRVSENIPEIISFVNKLLKNGSAYTSGDGSVYFKIDKCNYGKLQHLNVESTGHTIKKSAVDFALWKAAKADEPSWEIEAKAGRPGWHIECSAMASKLFGKQLDFHAGGLDLKFPHHENEEAQSCAYHNTKQWVDYWIHTGHLSLQGDQNKMSKSLKNTLSISEMLEKYTVDEFRMSCLLSNYRTSMEFGEESITVATGVLKKINSFFNDVDAYVRGQKPNVNYNANVLIEVLKKARLEFDLALKDDFNTSKAMNVLFLLMQHINKIINDQVNEEELSFGTFDVSAIQAASNFVRTQLTLFGLELNSKQIVETSERTNLERILNNLIEIRNDVRIEAMNTKNKDLFKICDVIRDKLKIDGIEIKDHNKNSSWSYKN